MSRSIKLIIAGLCLAFATTSTASAQVSQMRLFSPFPDDQFGGGVYERQGLYGSIGAGIVSISQPSDQMVGSTKGGQQYVTNVIPNLTSNSSSTTFTYSQVANQMSTAQFHADWETATEFVIGNQQGHHSWEVKGTVISPQRCDYDGIYGGIIIEDPAVVNVNNYNLSGASGNYYVWTGNSYQLLDQQGSGSVNQIGRLWMIVGLDSVGSGNDYNNNNSGNNQTGNTATNRYAFVPMPITYDSFHLTSKVNTWSVEAMYSYKFHPFRTGTLEALAGVRYTQFDGTFNFFGHASTKNESSYTITEVSILNTNTQGSGDNQQTQTSQSYGSYDFNYSSNRGADLGYSDWNFEAANHIVGPQVGARYTIYNNRWRFTGEGKYFAGFNRQNIYGYGTLGLKPMADSASTGSNNSNNNNNNNSNNNNNNNNNNNSSSSNSNSNNTSETGGLQSYTPIGTVANAFNYSKHYDAYTNGVDAKVEAAWNWTEAIGFKVGYEMLYMDNIARATAVNDYRINEDGSVFGVKKNKKDRNFDTFVHGVMFTLTVNR